MGLSRADILRNMPAGERRVILAQMGEARCRSLMHDWRGFWARPEQLAPGTPGAALSTVAWTYWLMMAGRGFGKSRSGAEWCIEKARTMPGSHGLIAGRTYGDMQKRCLSYGIETDPAASGILAISPPDFMPRYIPNRDMLTWPNGSTAEAMGAEEPEKFRGPNTYWVWADELCLAKGTMVETEDGRVPIDEIKAGCRVWTRDGLRLVAHAWKTSDSAVVWELTMSNGEVIIGTPGHPVMVKGIGFLPLSSLLPGDILDPWDIEKRSHGTEGDGISTLQTEVTTPAERANYFTVKCIGSILEKFQKECTSIIKMGIDSIFQLKTLLHLAHLSTRRNTLREGGQDGLRSKDETPRCSSGRTLSQGRSRVPNVERVSTALDREQSFVQQNAEASFDTRNWNGNWIIRARRMQHAFTAEINFLNIGIHKSIALLRAQRKTLCKVLEDQKNASFAERIFWQEIQGRNAAQGSAATPIVVVSQVRPLDERIPVYNIEVEGDHEYYANGVLTHNCAWNRAQQAWDMIKLGLRLGDHPQACITTTPKPIQTIKKILANARTVVTGGTTYDNRVNLSDEFYEAIINEYEGTRLGRQELLAELLEDVPGALWKLGQIDADRVAEPPKDLMRIVVAVDPAVSTDEKSDETGIIVAGLGRDGHGYVLADHSGKYSPDGWAREAVACYHRWRADRVVGERNNGGDMVESTVRTVDPAVSYKSVWASRGKQTRAEPVAALYEQHKVHHVGTVQSNGHRTGVLVKLEDQLTQWDPSDSRQKSPDRLDAMVWALTELMLEGRMSYITGHEEIYGDHPLTHFGDM